MLLYSIKWLICRLRRAEPVSGGKEFGQLLTRQRGLDGNLQTYILGTFLVLINWVLYRLFNSLTILNYIHISLLRSEERSKVMRPWTQDMKEATRRDVEVFYTFSGAGHGAEGPRRPTRWPVSPSHGDATHTRQHAPLAKITTHIDSEITPINVSKPRCPQALSTCPSSYQLSYVI